MTETLSFTKIRQIDHLWAFLMNFLSTQNVNVARYALNETFL